MSLLFMDGFDDGLALLGKYNTSTVGAVVGSGRTGSRQPVISSQVLKKVVAASEEHATFIVGFGYIQTGSSAFTDFLRFFSDTAATTHITLSTSANQAIDVRRGIAGTLLGSTANSIITAGVFSHIEVLVTLSDTVGAVTLKVNGAVVLNLTGIDTKNAGTKTVFEGIHFQGTGGLTFAIDDLYLCNSAGSINNTFLGDCSVETLFPNGNGNSSQLLGSDANSVDNYLLVDETAPNTTDYVGSATDNQKDTYALTNLTHIIGSIRGTQSAIYSAKSDSGAKSMSKVIRSGVADFDGADVVLSTAYTPYLEINETDPNTAAAWSISNVNAAEFGVKVRP